MSFFIFYFFLEAPSCFAVMKRLIGGAYLFNMTLCLGIKATLKVGGVSFLETGTTDGVGVIVEIDTARGKDSAVDSLEPTAVGEVDGSNDIGAHGSLLVIFTPVNVGSACAASGVKHMCGFDTLEFGHDSLTVLHANSSCIDFLAIGLKKRFEVASDPSLASPN